MLSFRSTDLTTGPPEKSSYWLLSEPFEIKSNTASLSVLVFPFQNHSKMIKIGKFNFVIMPLFNINSMFKCPPPSPNPHFKTGNYFYPLPLCPGALPFHPGNMDQAFNPFFPAYYLLALGPFPLPPLLRPAQTRQNRKCCHEEQEGCPHLWPLLRCQHRTPEPLSLAVPREGRCPEVLGRCTLNVQWCSLACLVPKGKRGPAQGGAPLRSSSSV